MDTPSEDLLARSTSGDGDAMDELLRRHLPGLRAFVRLRLGKVIRSRETSGDIVQSVARDVLENADRFRFGGESGFRQWLFKTAQRKISNKAAYWKAQKRDVRRLADDDSALLDEYRSFCTPSRDVEAREGIEAIERAFDSLSDEHREVILLARIVGLTRAQIGEQMGRSEIAVRALLSRALAQFTAKLANVE